MRLQHFGRVLDDLWPERQLARDVERMVKAGAVDDDQAKREIERAIERLRDHAQAFFADLAFAHRGQGRAKNEERVRATTESLGQTHDASVNLCGSLDILESTLALLRKPSQEDDEDALKRGEDAATLARRAGQLRDELRFLLRGNDDSYVYFVEFRGRGTFLRASPIDVSTIVRALLLDRMQTTVLTSATLTVDGRFDYIRARLGINEADEIRRTHRLVPCTPGLTQSTASGGSYRLAAGEFHRGASKWTQRASISAVAGYSSLSIMFLSRLKSISLWI